jgi:hypothetical protein
MQLMAKESDRRKGPLIDTAVSSQLERMLASEHFRHSDRMLVETLDDHLPMRHVLILLCFIFSARLT